MVVIQDDSQAYIDSVFDQQRKFFDNGNTKAYSFRLDALKKLRASIVKLEKEILSALANDSGKPEFEAYISDIGVVYDEIDFTISNLDRWMAPVEVNTPITIQVASSTIYYDPLGVVAIFAPWNYPFNLAIIPLVGAIAAGNCIMLKPAHETAHVSTMIKKVIEDAFPSQHIAVISGQGAVIGGRMLDHHTFNHIFFTGSAAVGKIIMAQAARTLTPVTLELGGKSPTIVDKSIHLDTAINRIVWAKYFNCGQTCIAPDYILVHRDIKEEFIRRVIAKIQGLYGDKPELDHLYPRIINTTRFDKLTTYLTQGKLLYGGNTNREQRYIQPTVIELDHTEGTIMQDEIFGPIMPILTWSDRSELLTIIRKNRYPLTCYIFSSDRTLHRYIIDNVEFGSGCINDAMAHFANHNMPFGGVQYSGIGKYHGRNSFQTFSNAKPILKTSTIIDLPLRYIPHSGWKSRLARLFMGKTIRQ
jgi:aldehyde dehydrogenase (NAD+)